MEVSPLSTYNRKEPEPYDQWVRRIRAKWLGDPSPAELMWRIRVLSTPGYGAELEPYRTEVEELAQRRAVAERELLSLFTTPSARFVPRGRTEPHPPSSPQPDALGRHRLGECGGPYVCRYCPPPPVEVYCWCGQGLRGHMSRDDEPCDCAQCQRPQPDVTYGA